MSLQVPPDPLTVEVVETTGYTYAEVHDALERLADAGLPAEEAMDVIEELAERGYTPEESATFTLELVRGAELGSVIIGVEVWEAMPLSVRARSLLVDALGLLGAVGGRLLELARRGA